MNRPTDKPTDKRTDTSSYRDAITTNEHLGTGAGACVCAGARRAGARFKFHISRVFFLKNRAESAHKILSNLGPKKSARVLRSALKALYA